VHSPSRQPIATRPLVSFLIYEDGFAWRLGARSVLGQNVPEVGGEFSEELNIKSESTATSEERP
jgi:hypothetical protein